MTSKRTSDKNSEDNSVVNILLSIAEPNHKYSSIDRLLTKNPKTEEANQSHNQNQNQNQNPHRHQKHASHDFGALFTQDSSEYGQTPTLMTHGMRGKSNSFLGTVSSHNSSNISNDDSFLSEDLGRSKGGSSLSLDSNDSSGIFKRNVSFDQDDLDTILLKRSKRSTSIPQPEIDDSHESYVAQQSKSQPESVINSLSTSNLNKKMMTHSIPDESETKRRQRITKEQQEILEEVFDNTAKPSSEIRQNLAQRLGMTPRRVQIWFQNKRAKSKKLGKALPSNKSAKSAPVISGNKSFLGGIPSAIPKQSSNDSSDGPLSNMIQDLQLGSPRAPFSPSSGSGYPSSPSSSPPHPFADPSQRSESPIYFPTGRDRQVQASNNRGKSINYILNPDPQSFASPRPFANSEIDVMPNRLSEFRTSHEAPTLPSFNDPHRFSSPRSSKGGFPNDVLSRLPPQFEDDDLKNINSPDEYHSQVPLRPQSKQTNQLNPIQLNDKNKKLQESADQILPSLSSQGLL